MKVILLQNIKGVGRVGDIKNVADGYGRNYLLANKLAKIATETSIKETEGLKRKNEAVMKVADEKAREIAEKAKNLVLEFTKKASKTGTLFASLTKEEIAEQLSKAVGAKVESDMVDLDPSTSSGQEVHGEHIKQLGEHLIQVELAPEVIVELRVVIKGE